MSEDEKVIEGEFVEEEMPVTQIVPHEESGVLAPAGTIDDLLGRYNLQAEFIKKVLKEGTDYGKIPGSSKDTLLKPGAEKITTLFGLSIKFPLELRRTVEDWTGADHGGEPFFFYEDTCQLWKGDVLIAEATGSCNSWEKKYRYRQPKLKCPACGHEGALNRSKFDDKGWYCWDKKGGCGANFPYQTPDILNQDTTPVKSDDVFDQVNTIKKMSQKRALVASTLMAGNVSDYFTQDIEDMPDYGESGSAPKKENVDPAQVKVPFKKAKTLFNGEAPTIVDLFAKDAGYCQWIYDNTKGDIGDAMREFIDKMNVVQQQSQETGIPAKPQVVSESDTTDGIKTAKTILEQTEGNLTPSHYWPIARGMGLAESVCADIASQFGDSEGWRKALEEAVKVAETK